MYPYEKLRAANVIATLTAIDLASTGRPKNLVFVSSTSAIDAEYYVHLSESFVNGSHSQYSGVPESDTLEGAKSTLKTGYGQTKWVSEKLLFEAGKRGLHGHIVRPGYVVGHSRTAGERGRSPSCYPKLIPFTASHKYGRFCLAFGQGLRAARSRP